MKGIRTYIGYYKTLRAKGYPMRLERRKRYFAYVAIIETAQGEYRCVYTVRPRYKQDGLHVWTEPIGCKSRGK